MYNEELDNSPIILILHNILNLHYVASSGLMMGVFHCFISGGTLSRRPGDTATNGREGGTVHGGHSAVGRLARCHHTLARVPAS